MTAETLALITPVLATTVLLAYKRMNAVVAVVTVELMVPLMVNTEVSALAFVAERPV